MKRRDIYENKGLKNEYNKPHMNGTAINFYGIRKQSEIIKGCARQDKL